MRSLARIFVVYLGVGCSLLSAQIELLATKEIAGTEKDLSEAKVPLGGMGSGIAQTGRKNEYVMVTDAGKKNGPESSRFHTFQITLEPGDRPELKARLLSTTLLTNEKGKSFVGSPKAIEDDYAKSLRLDPEAIRVGHKGTHFISDEYGPWIYEFNEKGQRVRSLALPEKFLPKTPSEDPAKELPPTNTRGRQPNRGMEGLAISPDGTKLFGIMQSPLIQDGALNKDNERIGKFNRIVEVELKTGTTREFVYPLEIAGAGVNEILAINSESFLVLERDGKTKSRHRKLYRVDLSKATDVSAVASLPSERLPREITPVTKVEFLDFQSPRLGLPRDSGKLEGLSFGPDLPDRRRLLFVTTDNDYDADTPTKIYAFGVDRDDLPGFEPQVF